MAGQTWNQLLRLIKRRTSEGLWWEQLFSKTSGGEPLWLDKTGLGTDQYGDGGGKRWILKGDWMCHGGDGNGTRSGEPLWLDKPGFVVGGIESEDKVNDFESMEIVVGGGSCDQEWRACGQTWSQ